MSIYSCVKIVYIVKTNNLGVISIIALYIFFLLNWSSIIYKYNQINHELWTVDTYYVPICTCTYITKTFTWTMILHNNNFSIHKQELSLKKSKHIANTLNYNNIIKIHLFKNYNVIYRYNLSLNNELNNKVWTTSIENY